jgi:hypothetical protein
VVVVVKVRRGRAAVGGGRALQERVVS